MHESGFGPSRYFAAMQQSVAIGVKRTLTADTLEPLLHAFFRLGEKEFVGHPLCHTNPSFFRPCHTVQRMPAPSTTSGTTARKSPCSTPQRLGRVDGFDPESCC